MKTSKELEMQQDQWIENVLSTSQKIQAVDANPFLFHKISTRIHTEEHGNKLQPSLKIQWVAAACLLIALNLFAFNFKYKSSKNQVQQNTINSISNAMNTATTYNY